MILILVKLIIYLFYIMSCGCANQSNSPASHFVCSTDYTHRRIAPMIVNNVVAYDNKSFITSKTPIPERSSRIGMIFNNKAYKLTSSQGIDNQKQIKFDLAVKDTTSNNNVRTNIPLANFGIFNKSRLRYKQNSQNTDTRRSDINPPSETREHAQVRGRRAR